MSTRTDVDHWVNRLAAISSGLKSSPFFSFSFLFFLKREKLQKNNVWTKVWFICRFCNGVLVWCWSTFVVLANAQWRYITHPCTHAASKITPEGLALEDRRSLLAICYPNKQFSSRVRWIVPLQECRPCGAQVKTTDPERWQEPGDSSKGESRSNLDFFQCQR